MKTAEQILQERINSYNSVVNDMSKFALNKREIAMFVDAMNDYAKQEIYSSYDILIRNVQEAEWRNERDALGFLNMIDAQRE